MLMVITLLDFVCFVMGFWCTFVVLCGYNVVGVWGVCVCGGGVVWNGLTISV